MISRAGSFDLLLKMASFVRREASILNIKVIRARKLAELCAFQRSWSPKVPIGIILDLVARVYAHSADSCRGCPLDSLRNSCCFGGSLPLIQKQLLFCRVTPSNFHFADDLGIQRDTPK